MLCFRVVCGGFWPKVVIVWRRGELSPLWWCPGVLFCGWLLVGSLFRAVTCGFTVWVGWWWLWSCFRFVLSVLFCEG